VNVPTTSPVAPRPTRARHWVIVFAVALAVIQYVDRVCIAKAMPSIRGELHFSDVETGYIFGAFTLAYALFEIPSGWLGDRFGPRKVLLRVVLWWSAFTAATGWVTSAAAMIIVRFLFGAGEAGCFPNVTKAFTAWLPRSEWFRGQALLWLSARWGGAATPLLVITVLQIVSWRIAFQVFALLGIAWAFVFFRWFRDSPHQHPSVNEAERQLLDDNVRLDAREAPVPWRLFLRSPTAWLLWLQYAALSYVWYFYITWFPTYLDSVSHGRLGPTALALMAGLPLFGGGFGSLLAARIEAPVGRLLASEARARKAIAVVGFLAAAGCFLASIYAADPVTMAVLMGFAGLFNDFVMPSSWRTCMDVGGRFAGTFSGSMNMFGNLGGFIAPIAMGYILSLTGAYTLALFISSGMYVVGALCWMLLDPETRLDRDDAATPAPPVEAEAPL
jgi:MFS transporter, ACS family, glucarate transporter